MATIESISSIKQRTKIPGPKGRPFIGILPEFAKDSLGFLVDSMNQYGNVVYYHLGPRPVYQINHPDGIQQVLQDNNHNYTKEGFKTDFIEIVVGDGLFVSEGATWLRQRRLMQPAFHRQQIQKFGEMMVTSTQKMLDRWEAISASDITIDVAAEMMHLTLEIVNQALFSTSIDDVAGENLQDIEDSLNFIFDDVNYRFQRPFYPLWAPTGRNRKYKEAVRMLDQVIYRIIQARRDLLRTNPQSAPDDLLTTLMTAKDEDTGTAMSDQQLRDEVMTMFIAGHETTANTLAWAFYLLACHPDIEEKVITELEYVLAERTPDPKDLSDLPYTRMVIDETLRLYPAAWITNRISVETDTVCGYTIPANAFVTISPYAVHRHPDFWDKPDEFQPERFSPEITKGRHPYAFIPFGGGPRLCIGRNFALMEAPLVLAAALQRFQLQLSPGQVVKPGAAATLKPEGGLKMILKSRRI